MLTDIAISGDRNVIKKEAEKILKYKDRTILSCDIPVVSEYTKNGAGSRVKTQLIRWSILLISR
jgi:hypothetical protein